MNVEPTRTDLDQQVQGLPLTGYDKDDRFMRTRVLKVKCDVHARRFVEALLRRDCVDFGGRRTPRSLAAGVNIGFTHAGLKTLGVPEHVLRELKDKSPAFGQGAAQRAAQYLGDAGVSAVERWNPVFRQQNAHVWLSMHGNTQAAIDRDLQTLRSLPGAVEGLEGWCDGTVRDGEQMLSGPGNKIREVHFGFRDNITKPSILVKGKYPLPKPGEAPHQPRPGELLLGYPNNWEVDVWTAQAAPGLTAFLRNGSFGVLRQLQQDVAAFEQYLQRQVNVLRRRGYRFVTTEFLKAKMCGRWPNGAPVLPHESSAPPSPDGKRLLIDFGKDREGLGCPFGAHVRRANPRNDPLMPPRERILFRRGIPYGKRYTGVPDTEERGLLGLFFCARIDDQFELLIAEWLEKNPLGPANFGTSKDPLSGQHCEPRAEFHIPLPGGECMALDGLSAFVRTRGTLYALFPSRRALAMIASGQYGRAS